MRYLITTLVFLFLCSVAIADVPQQLHYNGYLTNSIGEAVECPDALQCADSYDMTFRIYETSENGVVLWEETHSAVPLYGGSFHIALGENLPITAEILNGPTWLAFKVNDGPEMSPRQQILSAAYALRAKDADNAASASNAEQLGGLEASQYASQAALSQLEASLAPVATEGLSGDLADGDDDTLANMPCAPGMVPKASAGGWVCDIDETGNAVDTTLSESQVDLMVSNNGYVLESELNAVQSALSGALTTITVLQDTLDSLGSTSGSQSTEIIALQSAIDAAQTNINALQAALNEAEEDITNLQSVDFVLQTAISDLDTSLAPVAKSGSFTELIAVPAGLADGDDDYLSTLLCADGEVAKRSGTSWVCAEDRDSVVAVGAGGLCDAAATGQMYFDVALNALFVCNGTEYKQINACTGTCALPSTTACGLGVEDDCGNSCGTIGTGLNVSQCADESTIICGDPIYDDCTNLCPTAGTKLQQSQCYGLDVLTPCGVTVVDPCGNPCGNVGLVCPDTQTCQEGVCLDVPEGFAEFIAVGTHAFNVPVGVHAVIAIAIGGGANGQMSGGGSSGGGGGGAKSILAVTPGQSITLEVGRGGSLQGVFELNGGSSSVGAPFNIVAGGGTSNGGGGTGTGGNMHNSRGGSSSPGSSHSNAVKLDGLPGEIGDAGGAGAWLQGFGGVNTPGVGLGYGGGGGAQCCIHYGGVCAGASGGANGFPGGNTAQDGGGPSGGKTGTTNSCNTHFHGGGGGSYGGGGGNDGQGVNSSCLNQFLGGDGAHGYVRFEWGPTITVE